MLRTNIQLSVVPFPIFVFAEVDGIVNGKKHLNTVEFLQLEVYVNVNV